MSEELKTEVPATETLATTAPPAEESPKEEAAAKPLNEEQKAYVVCDRELKAFLKALTSSYGNSDARREAWAAAAIYPFAKDDPKFRYTEAKKLFDHFQEINSAKFVMFLHGMEREGKIKILQPLETDNINPVAEETKTEEPRKENENALV